MSADANWLSVSPIGFTGEDVSFEPLRYEHIRMNAPLGPLRPPSAACHQRIQAVLALWVRAPDAHWLKVKMSNNPDWRQERGPGSPRQGQPVSQQPEHLFWSDALCSPAPVGTALKMHDSQASNPGRKFEQYTFKP